MHAMFFQCESKMECSLQWREERGAASVPGVSQDQDLEERLGDAAVGHVDVLCGVLWRAVMWSLSSLLGRMTPCPRRCAFFTSTVAAPCGVTASLVIAPPSARCSSNECRSARRNAGVLHELCATCSSRSPNLTRGRECCTASARAIRSEQKSPPNIADATSSFCLHQEAASEVLHASCTHRAHTNLVTI
jgi:hypothetical protein